MRKKRLAKQVLCCLLSTGMVLSGIAPKTMTAMAETEIHEIVVDGEVVDPVNTFKGFGAVTCNNTSRLLMDYKEEHPDNYWAMMELLFNPEKGAGLNHIKVEMGGDVNSSSGTEPSTMRSPDEKANVLRGAGWHFAADAKTINPDVTVEILRWGEPKWTQEGTGYESKFEARYQWYKQTIDAVFDEYNYKIDYVSPSQNERRHDYGDNTEWIRYCAKRLNEDAEKEEARYDYSAIQIVASDTHSNSKDIAGRMLGDAELMDLIDVVSDHYTLYGNDSLTRVNQEYGKEIWYSEAIAPMINAKYRINVDASRGGVGGKVGMADLATRFINSYSYAGAGKNPARMTRFEFQPAIGAFYEGSAYSPKQLIGAFDPWSGYYDADGGLQMVGHFMEFADLGWNYLPDACYGDGNYTDGGVTVDTGTNNYMTVKDPETGDYSMMFANNTSQTRQYQVTVKNLEKASSHLNIWETRGPDEGQEYDANWMQMIGTVTPSKSGAGTYTYPLTVKPYSIVTVTSLLDRGMDYAPGQNDPGVERTVLELPYRDDFEYEGYQTDEKGRSYLERRGGTPRYTTDQNGAFEVEKDNLGNHVLTQMINKDNRPYDWGVWNSNNKDEANQTTGRPRTVLGDHRWTNYTAGIDFKLDLNSPDCFENYAGLGVRQMVHNGNAANDLATYTFRVFRDGSCELYCRRDNQTVKANMEGFDASIWHHMQVRADENEITAYVDGQKVAQFTDPHHTAMSGRVTLVSGFYNTEFDNLEILPIEGKAASADQKLDDTSNLITWNGNWNHVLNEGYEHYNRTRTYGGAVEKGVYAFDCGQVRYYKGGNPLAWGSNSTNAWGSAGDQAHYEFDFTGSGIEIYGEANGSNGTGDVYIDNVKVGTVNYNSGQGGTGHDVFGEGLNLDPNTVHTLKVVASSSFISLKKLKVLDEPEEGDGEIENSLSIDFHGTGIQIFGKSGSAKIRVEVDGAVVEPGYSTPWTENRQTTYSLQNLEEADHEVKITVIEGTYHIDGIDLIGETGTSAAADREPLRKLLDFAKELNPESVTCSQEIWDQLQTAITAGEAAWEAAEASAMKMAYLSIRSLLNVICPDESVVELEEHIIVATALHQNPVLPEVVRVKNADGTVKEEAVEWMIRPSMFHEVWEEVLVTGTLTELDAKVTALVEVVPGELVYFIDSGYYEEPGSAEYQRIMDIATLTNDKPDQVTNGKNWGYVKEGVEVKGSLQSYSKTQTGIYAKNSEEIIYKLPLEEGTYDFTGTCYEWWGMNRYMEVTVAYPDLNQEMQTTSIGTVNISGSNKTASLSGTVTIPVSGMVEYRITMPQGNQKPVISWLAVNRHQEESEAEEVKLPLIAAEDMLPDTVLTGEGDQQQEVSVSWKKLSGDWKKTGSVVELQGRLDGGGTILWKPTVYSSKQVYFIDCGSGDVESPVYQEVAQTAEGLINLVSDQVYAESSEWGYVDENLSKKNPEPHSYGLFATGFYGNSNEKGSSFSYQLTLPAGEYTVNTGHTEWWATNNRTTKVTASYVDADGTVKETVLGSAGWNTGIQWTKGYVQGHLSIPEDETQVTMTFHAETAKAPAVSYISIEESEPLDISRIKIDQLPNKVVYDIQSDEFDPAGMVINGYSRQGLVRQLDFVEDEIEVEGFDLSETGVKTITLLYTNAEGEQLSASFKVTMYDSEDMKADSIKVVTPPEKQIYIRGEYFDGTGMDVRLLMMSEVSRMVPGMTEVLTDGDYDVQYDFTTAGEKTVTIIYAYLNDQGEETELKDTIKVTVMAEDKEYRPSGIRVTRQPRKTVYELGEVFDPEGMEIRAVLRTEGSKEILAHMITNSEYTIQEKELSQVGKTTIKVSYDEFEAAIPITVTDSKTEVIEGGLNSILEEVKLILGDDISDYMTEEEKKDAAQTAVTALKEKLDLWEDLEVTHAMLETISEFETLFEKAYPQITSRVSGEQILAKDAAIIGGKLNADLNEENQSVELKLTKTVLPEEVETGKAAVALDIKLYVSGEDKEELEIPVLISMNIPQGISDKNLIICHYLNGGGTEDIVPVIRGNKMEFIVTSFSTFVVTSDKPDDTGSGDQGNGNQGSGNQGSGSSSSRGSSRTIKVRPTDGSISGNWKQNETGWWFVTGPNTYLKETWGKINGVWYYFNADGYMAVNTVTPDGYRVGADGAWIH